MTNRQRIKNDMVTLDRREAEDQVIIDQRNKNDEQTSDRRFKADKVIGDSRIRNDELTANRRELKDGNLGMVLAVFVAQILLALSVGIFLF